MEQLLLELHQLLDKARTLNKDYEQRLRDIKQREEDAVALHHQLQEKSVGMQQREAEVSKIENLQAFHKSATDLHNTSNLRLQAATEAERALKIHHDTVHMDLDNKRALVKREAEAVEKQRNNIDAEVTKRVQEVLKNAGIPTS